MARSHTPVVTGNSLEGIGSYDLQCLINLFMAALGIYAAVKQVVLHTQPLHICIAVFWGTFHQHHKNCEWTVNRLLKVNYRCHGAGKMISRWLHQCTANCNAQDDQEPFLPASGVGAGTYSGWKVDLVAQHWGLGTRTQKKIAGFCLNRERNMAAQVLVCGSRAAGQG